MPVSLTPWFGSVTGGLANTLDSLQTLLTALPAAVRPRTPGVSGVLKACYIQIQADPLGAGAKYRITRSDGSSTDYGLELVAGQLWGPPSFDFNLYRLDQIFLTSDTASAIWKVVFITR